MEGFFLGDGDTPPDRMGQVKLCNFPELLSLGPDRAPSVRRRSQRYENGQTGCVERGIHDE
jgi:hypothetical protein